MSKQQTQSNDTESGVSDSDIDIEQYRSQVAQSDVPEFEAADTSHALRQSLGDSEVREWKFPPEEASERFAQLYARSDAFIREDISNAETACIDRCVVELQEHNPEVYTDAHIQDLEVKEIIQRARRETSYEPQVTVKQLGISDDPSIPQTIDIEDNGIGMSVERFEVLRNVGFSTSHMHGSFIGQFGMGVVSNLDAGDRVRIDTVSRQTDERFGVYMLNTGFKDLPTNRDRYGTQFRITLDRDTQEEIDIPDAVEEFSEWTRVPVMFEQYTADGEKVNSEEYPSKHLEDDYNESDPVLVYDDEYVRVVCSPSASGTTLNIAQPIDRNNGYSTKSYSAPYRFDVRVKREDGVVVDGPNEGVVPISDSDYRSKLLEEREPYIPQSYLSGRTVIGHRIPTGPDEGKIAVSVDETDDADFYTTKENYSLVDDDEDISDWQPVVASGEHEGRLICSDDRWEQLDSGEADEYVKTSDLTDEDVPAAEPTGDRDRYEEGNTDFWTWCASKAQSAFRERVGEICQQISSVEELQDLEETEKQLFFDGIDQFGPSVTTTDADQINNHFEDELGISFSDSFASVLPMVKDSVKVVEGTQRNFSRKRYQTRREIWKVLIDLGETGDVYMAVSPNDKKARFVQELDDSNQIVIVNDTSHYEIYEERFGWTRLRDIDLYKLSEQFDADDDLLDKYEQEGRGNGKRQMLPGHEDLPGPANLDPRTKELTLHYGGGDYHESITAGKLAESFSENGCYEKRSRTFNHIALFPSTETATVGRYKWMGQRDVAVAKCPEYVFQYLTALDGIDRWSDVLQEAKDTTVYTSAGPKYARNLTEDDVFIFPDADRVELFSEYGSKLYDAISNISSSVPEIESPTVTVLESDEMPFEDWWMAACDPHSHANPTIITLDGGNHNVPGRINTISDSTLTDMSVYADLAVPDGWEQSTIYQESIGEMYRPEWSIETFEIIRTLQRLDDCGKQPASLDDEEIDLDEI